jgi:hypothetical protein
MGSEITIRELVKLIARLTRFEGETHWGASKPDEQPGGRWRRVGRASSSDSSPDDRVVRGTEVGARVKVLHATSPRAHEREASAAPIAPSG